MHHLLILLSLFPLILASGYMEIRLKSQFYVNATVETVEEVWFPTNKKTYKVQIIPDRIRLITKIPVKFGRPGIVMVRTEPMEKFEGHYLTVKSERWDTQVMSITSETMQLPLNGFRIDIKCDKNWYGTYCDKSCNDDQAKYIHRRCTFEGAMGCPLNFHGANCDLPIQQNQTSCQCQNGGLCMFTWKTPTDPTDVFSCECPHRYEGDKCEHKKYDYAQALLVGMHLGHPEKNITNPHAVSHLFVNGTVENELSNNSSNIQVALSVGFVDSDHYDPFNS